MADFDLVIRGGTAATAVDVFRTDIGVRDGRIVALAADLPAGERSPGSAAPSYEPCILTKARARSGARSV